LYRTEIETNPFLSTTSKAALWSLQAVLDDLAEMDDGTAEEQSQKEKQREQGHLFF
jgi:hypothetical protein